MRGNEHQQQEMFCYGSLEERVRRDHPLRRIHELTESVLTSLRGRLDDSYSEVGRPSIPPECLLRAMLLQVLFSIRSERSLMDQVDLHLGFRWFVGLGMNEPVWDASTFSKNRERLLGGDIAREFLEAVLAQARTRQWLSDEQFTVDGTLIQAWASRQSYQPKNDPPAPGQGSGRNGRLQRRDLYASETDPDARIYRKSARDQFHLAYLGHVLMDARQGLIAAACVTQASSRAEREAALEMVRELAVRKRRIRVAADKAYDEQTFVEQLRTLGATPQVTQYTRRPSAIDGRTTRHPGYRRAQRQRKRIESIFAWLKQIGGQRRTRFRGRERVGWMFTFTAAAYNLIRMAKLSWAAAA